jgi:hypothetical protein
MYAKSLSKPGLDFWSLVARGHEEKRMTGRSTPQNEEIREIAEYTGTAESNYQLRRRGDPSNASIM